MNTLPSSSYPNNSIDLTDETNATNNKAVQINTLGYKKTGNLHFSAELGKSWTFFQGFKEIVQNFIDQCLTKGNTEDQLLTFSFVRIDSDTRCWNFYHGQTLCGHIVHTKQTSNIYPTVCLFVNKDSAIIREDLIYGSSSKQDDEQSATERVTIGEHGEGLKIAIAVFLAKQHRFEIVQGGDFYRFSEKTSKATKSQRKEVREVYFDRKLHKSGILKDFEKIKNYLKLQETDLIQIIGGNFGDQEPTSNNATSNNNSKNHTSKVTNKKLKKNSMEEPHWPPSEVLDKKLAMQVHKQQNDSRNNNNNNHNDSHNNNHNNHNHNHNNEEEQLCDLEVTGLKEATSIGKTFGLFLALSHKKLKHLTPGLHDDRTYYREIKTKYGSILLPPETARNDKKSVARRVYVQGELWQSMPSQSFYGFNFFGEHFTDRDRNSVDLRTYNYYATKCIVQATIKDNDFRKALLSELQSIKGQPPSHLAGLTHLNEYHLKPEELEEQKTFWKLLAEQLTTKKKFLYSKEVKFVQRYSHLSDERCIEVSTFLHLLLQGEEPKQYFYDKETFKEELVSQVKHERTHDIQQALDGDTKEVLKKVFPNWDKILVYHQTPGNPFIPYCIADPSSNVIRITTRFLSLGSDLMYKLLLVRKEKECLPSVVIKSDPNMPKTTTTTTTTSNPPSPASTTSRNTAVTVAAPAVGHSNHKRSSDSNQQEIKRPNVQHPVSSDSSLLKNILHTLLASNIIGGIQVNSNAALPNAEFEQTYVCRLSVGNQIVKYDASIDPFIKAIKDENVCALLSFCKQLKEILKDLLEIEWVYYPQSTLWMGKFISHSHPPKLQINVAPLFLTSFSLETGKIYLLCAILTLCRP